MCGRRQRPRRCPGTPPASSAAPGHAQRSDALHRRPGRHGVRLGPGGSPAPRPAVQGRYRRRRVRRGREPGQPPVREGSAGRRDRHHRHAHPGSGRPCPRRGQRRRAAPRPVRSCPAAGSWSWAATGFLALADSDTGRVVRRLSGHRGLSHAGDQRRRAPAGDGSDDNTVRFWSLPDGQSLGAPLLFRRQSPTPS